MTDFIQTAEADVKNAALKIYDTAVQFVEANGTTLEQTIVSGVKTAAANLEAAVAPAVETFVNNGFSAVVAAVPFLSKADSAGLSTEEQAVVSGLIAKLQALI